MGSQARKKKRKESLKAEPTETDTERGKSDVQAHQL